MEVKSEIFYEDGIKYVRLTGESGTKVFKYEEVYPKEYDLSRAVAELQKEDK